jgi:PAS domain S-box-containing protein
MERKSKSGKHHSESYQGDLREIQERYEFIVNAYGELMTLINRDYVYELVNDSWCRTFGRSREDFIGKSVAQIWGSSKFKTEIKGKIDQCLKGKVFKEEDSFIIADGERRYYEVTYFPYRNSEKEITHVVGVTSDITERKMAEIALRKSRQELSELNVQKDQYLSIINSDLDKASRYVNSLLPDEFDTPHVRIQWKIVPSAKLGGDSLGYHWIDEEHLAIYMLDVTGHGVGAALHSVSILNMLKFETLHHTDFRIPNEVLHGLNQVFQMTGPDALFFTMWYIVFNKTSFELSYAGAGHPPLILFDENGTQEKLFSQNTMIGIDDRYEFRSDIIEIRKNTSVYMYTDGAYEVDLDDGSMMGIEALATELSNHQKIPSGEISKLYNFLLELNKGRSLEDDFTMMKTTINLPTP